MLRGQHKEHSLRQLTSEDIRTQEVSMDNQIDVVRRDTTFKSPVNVRGTVTERDESEDWL